MNNDKILDIGYHESETIVNIMKVNSILVNIDIIEGSCVNGKNEPTIHSFFPNVSPGYKIIERPNILTWFPISRSNISSMRVWLTDQNGDSIDMRGEVLTVRISIREKTNIEQSIINVLTKMKIISHI